MTTVLFDHGFELLHDRIDIRAIQPMTEEEYQVGGSTALLDAMGRTIHKISNVQKNTAEDYRAEQVMFVIITDGQENSSREYSLGQIKALVEQHKEQHGWEFIFLGANIDAIETAGHFGIGADRAQSFHADKEGLALNFAVISESVAQFRAGAKSPATGRRKSNKTTRPGEASTPGAKPMRFGRTTVKSSCPALLLPCCHAFDIDKVLVICYYLR